MQPDLLLPSLCAHATCKTEFSLKEMINKDGQNKRKNVERKSCECEIKIIQKQMQQKKKNQLMLAVWVATGDNIANKQLQVDALASTSRGEGHNQGQLYQKET